MTAVAEAREARAARAWEVLAHAERVYTTDTGLMHMASACGAPTVAVFGPTHPARKCPPGARWEPVSLLDPFDLEFAPHRPEQMTAVIENSSMLLGVPHWLRRAEDAPPLWPLLMEEAGLDELPMSPPSRPDRFTGTRAAFASGIPGLTTPPDRMRVDIKGWPGSGR